MGKVTTLYIPDAKLQAWKAFEELAFKEKGKRGTSEMLLQVLEEYLKAHGSGNPSFKLERFAEPGFAAYPTPWGKAIGYSELESFSWKEEDDMIAKLERTLVTVKNDRQAKRDADMKAKGILARVK